MSPQKGVFNKNFSIETLLNFHPVTSLTCRASPIADNAGADKLPLCRRAHKSV